MRPTFWTGLRFDQERMLVLGDGGERLPQRAGSFRRRGRAARIRSCALRILDAATISMALVILRVFSTLLILLRISLP